MDGRNRLGRRCPTGGAARPDGGEAHRTWSLPGGSGRSRRRSLGRKAAGCSCRSPRSGARTGAGSVSASRRSGRCSAYSWPSRLGKRLSFVPGRSRPRPFGSRKASPSIWWTATRSWRWSPAFVETGPSRCTRAARIRSRLVPKRADNRNLMLTVRSRSIPARRAVLDAGAISSSERRGRGRTRDGGFWGCETFPPCRFVRDYRASAT